MTELPDTWPEYCCAILETADGSLLLEDRPADAARAPATYTCFGGRREPGEVPLNCIVRELEEELGWRPAEPGRELERVVVLTLGSRTIAWFYRGRCDVPLDALCTEPGRRAVRVAPADLAGVPVSPWHRAALRAYYAGRPVAEVTDRWE